MKKANSQFSIKSRNHLLIIPLAILLLVTLAPLSASAQAPVHFNSCVHDTGSNGTVIVPQNAVMAHDQGYFTPETGDEIAIFRPNDPLCTGVMVWNAGDQNSALAVWGDDIATPEIDGMDSEEVMRWTVWDASENNAYMVIVTYVTTLPFDPDGAYGKDRFYQLVTFVPTAVTLVTFSTATAEPTMISFLLVSVLALATILLYRAYRKGAAVA